MSPWRIPASGNGLYTPTMTLPAPEPRLQLPPSPALAASVRRAAWLEPTGEVESLSVADAARRLTPDLRPIVCHAKATARRLGV
ncbi:MAG: hypothetical protein ACE5GT_01015, partial [Rhodospirillales bacterium]